MELPWKLSGCQGQKGEGLLGLHKSSGHRHTELWTSGEAQNSHPLLKAGCGSGAPRGCKARGGSRLGWLSSVCWVRGCPQLHRPQHPGLPSTPALRLWAGTRLAAAGSSSLFSCQRDVEPGYATPVLQGKVGELARVISSTPEANSSG